MGGMASYDAFLLLSFGGPEKTEDVVPFLENVTRGRGIPRERLEEVGEHYFLFGGVSPINQQCRDLIAEVRRDFEEHGLDLPVYWGNRNWQPMVEDTLADMARDGVRRAVALATSAHSSYSSHRQYLEDIDRAREAVLAGGGTPPEVDMIRPFCDHPGFLRAHIDHTRRALESLPEPLRGEARLLFSAHSLPTTMADASGDPQRGFGPGGAYVAQLRETARLITEGVGGDHPYELVYQSRSGPPSQPWLEPDVNDRLAELAGEGVRAVVIVPHGFVSDHMEVRYDLDVEAAATAEKLGIALARAAAPGTHPAFVSMVRDLVAERIDPQAPRASLGDLGPCPDVCPPRCCLRQ
jgi:protoporphyrin/coproporphyrin ferrochelatase